MIVSLPDTAIGMSGPSVHQSHLGAKVSVAQVPQYTFEYELMGPSLPDACVGSCSSTSIPFWLPMPPAREETVVP